jgi:signal transduction histidine kinase
MDPNTQTFYVIAAGLNFSLSLTLLTFSYLRPATLVTRAAATAILMAAVAMFAAGYAPLLPSWTVVGTNLLLIAAVAVLHSGVAAYCAQRPPTPDRCGWAIVALSAVPFWYWGLVQPNGIYRTVLLSFAITAVNGRTALRLGRFFIQKSGGVPVAVLGVLFAALSVWMGVRGLVLLTAAPVPVEHRGANPTAWVTVFWYIVLTSLIAVCVIWMEVERFQAARDDYGQARGHLLGATAATRDNLLLLWSAVVILAVGIISEVGITYQALYQDEDRRLQTGAALVSEARVEHRVAVVTEVDTLAGRRAVERIRPIAFSAALAEIVIVMLAVILTRVIRERDEQGRFIAMLSHELKTPLSALRMALGSEAMYRTARLQAMRSVEDMTGVIERCLLADRFRHGRVSLDLQRCDLGAVLRELCAVGALADRTVLEVSDLPECKTDLPLIRVVLSNLIDNAGKYGAAGQDVRIAASPKARVGKHGVAITVTNAVGSAGFPDERRVFQKYYRAPGAHRKTGSGLGLYLAFSLARLLGGRLHYLSTDSEVSFELWVPAAIR